MIAVAGLGATSAPALAAPGASFSPSGPVFADSNTTANPSQQQVTLTNTGTDSLVITGGAMSTNPEHFSVPVVTDLCANKTLAATASCTVVVKFQSNGVAGPIGGEVKYQTNIAVPPRGFLVRGNSPKAVARYETALSFPPTALGTTSTMPVTVANGVPAAVALTVAAQTVAPFGADVGACASVAPPPSTVRVDCTFAVTFTPTTLGAAAGTLTLPTNDPFRLPSITLGGTGIAAPVATPPPGTPGTPGIPGGPVTGVPPFAAKLEIARAGVQRSKQRLDVLAPITARASGKVRVKFHAAGRFERFNANVDSNNSRIRFEQSIPASQARMGTGILTINYPGDKDTQPQEVRLRAAARKAQLDANRPTITDGRLMASGTISDRARGVVRVQVLYEPPGQNTRTLEYNVPISNGRYSIDEKLPADVVTQIAARRGVVHSYTLFTGYLPQRMRGEMSSFQVLGPL